jgi:hypothetical protein
MSIRAARSGAAGDGRRDGPASDRAVPARRIDLTTGEAWPEAAVDYARETGQEDEDESDDPDKWLWVHCEGSRDGYRDMERFIGTVRDQGRAGRLEIAISGREAFRRFKDALGRWPGELDRWYVFSAERQRGRGPRLAGRRRLLRPQGPSSLLTWWT